MIGFGQLRVGLVAIGFVAGGFTWIPEGAAESFHLKTGKTVEGEILEATRNTVMLRINGTVLPTSLRQIEQIILSLEDGSELAGEFLGWKEGVYEIRSAGVLMRIKDGVIISDNPETATAKLETKPTAQPNNPEAKTSALIAMKGLPELTLKNGQVLVGHIIHATGSIVTFRLLRGGVVPTSRAQIDTIRFVSEDGKVLGGNFRDWSDHVYQLQNGDQELLASLSDDAVKAGPPPVTLQSESTVTRPLDEPVVTAIESADAAISPTPAIDRENGNGAASSNESPESQVSLLNDTVADGAAVGVSDADLGEATGAGGPVSEAAVAALSGAGTSLAPAETKAEEQNAPALEGPHLVVPTVADVEEDGEAVVFEFRLDQPADRPLVILYAATDDTALAGQDFEAKSGVITFSAGSQYAEVRVPLIDDEQSETSEQFHLFLSGDPETIQFSQRQIPAIISDND